MNDEQQPEMEQPQPQPEQERSMLRRRRAALGYDGRSERRALRGAARRRKIRTRLWLVTAPTVVLIALVVTLLVLFGGPNDSDTATTSSTTLASKTGGALLVIEQNGVAQVAVVFQARESGGVALVIPGLTLVRAGDRFLTVAELYAAGDDDAFADVLGNVFGARAQTVASAPWEGLRSALVSAGLSSDLPLLQTPQESRQLAAALKKLTTDGAGLAGLWGGVELQGDASGFRSALDAVAGPGKQWTAVAVTGNLVEGKGFKYIEPEVAVAKALLGGTLHDSAITVDLQNGSGAVGIVEAAAAQLQPLGYQITPSGNSADFPNVVRTRIVFSTGTAEAAARVQALLGVGAITEDAEAGLDQVVVVLGSDYAPAVDAGADTGN